MFFFIKKIRGNTLDFSQNAVSVTLFGLINVGEFLVALLILRFIVSQILVERGRNCKKFIPQLITFLHFIFRANYTHKRRAKCTVDHRVMKIYRNNGPQNQKAILYFSVYLYYIIIFHIIITFTLRTFFVFLVVQVKKFLISFNLLWSLVIHFSRLDLRFLGTTCTGNAS